MIIVAGGLITGLLQWRILRKASAVAGWWIIASTVGWSLAGLTVFINDRLLGTVVGLAGLFLFLVFLMVGGVLRGGVGGLTLRGILKPAPAEA